MKSVFKLMDKVAPTMSNVLIHGESGTGKELIAKAVHSASSRARRPFVAINCASIPSGLIESELFGYEKGAFTGAVNRTMGKFEAAGGGTLFLDEISTLKLDLQAKLLRIIQERELTRLGGNEMVTVDVRLITATNTRLEKCVREGGFREDLYFRLNVVPVDLPPLRGRRGDIPLLTGYFMDRFNRRMNRNIRGISPGAMAVLEGYCWPGNIRELENLMERIVVLGSDGDVVRQKDLPTDYFQNESLTAVPESMEDQNMGLIQARQVFERQYILKALKTCNWNQSRAALRLKIHRNTLIHKMKVFNISKYNGDDFQTRG